MSQVTVRNVLTGSKISVAGPSTRGYSQHITSNHVPGNRSHDNYGREGLCHNSLFALYPGRADCTFQGLLNNETNMRPAYWRYIGDCDGNDFGYVGGKDQMILGYGAGPRGMVYDAVQDGLYGTRCSGLGCEQAQSQCEKDKFDAMNKKYNFGGSRYTLSREVY